MKRYKDYMDRVTVSDTLHERLKDLEEPKKKPRPLAKWGAMAAVMALIVGAGAWGLSLSQRDWDALVDNFDANAEPGIADVDREEIGEPDIAYEDQNPGQLTEPSGGGYEVIHGTGPNAMVSYFALPYLNWVDADGSSMMDYALAPPSAVSRGAAEQDAVLFAGGEYAMSAHLLWNGLNWGGALWFEDDLTPCAASLYAVGNSMGNSVSLSLEVLKGGKVPSCIVFPEDFYEYSTWGGVEITALKDGGYMVTDDGVELNEKREVSFFCGGVGYKLTLYADDAARADELCARFVRYAVDGGFDLDALSADDAGGDFVPHYDLSNEDGADPTHYAAPASYSVGEPNWEDGAAQTTPYDPGVTADAETRPFP